MSGLDRRSLRVVLLMGRNGSALRIRAVHLTHINNMNRDYVGKTLVSDAQRVGKGSMTRSLNGHSYIEEVWAASRLGVPLALGELGWMSTYIVDAMMIGRMSHSTLAIGASSLWNTPLNFSGVLVRPLERIRERLCARGGKKARIVL